jgi:dCMP deaminase
LCGDFYKMDKPNYHDYFLTIAYVVAQRSIDPSTKCGAILVSEDKRILSTGYNGPIKNSIDGVVPLERPWKYAHILHAEENCLLAYSGSTQDLANSTMYVTGKPCHRCLRMILQRGITNIIHTNGNVAVMQDDTENDICETIKAYAPPFKAISLDNLDQIIHLLRKTEEYIKIKNEL